MVYQLLYYAHPHVTRLDDVGKTFLVQHYAYKDFSKLIETARRDRLDNIHPGEIYRLRYRTSGPPSQPKVPECVAGLDTDEERKTFLDFLGSAAKDPGLILDLAAEFGSGIAGYAGGIALSVVAFFYGIYSFAEALGALEDWQGEYVLLCSTAYATVSIRYNTPLATRTTVPTPIWLWPSFLSWSSRITVKDETTFCQPLQTAWEKAFSEAQKKAEEQLVKEYKEMKARVHEKLRELAKQGKLNEDDEAAVEYFRCVADSMTLDNFRELRRMQTEREQGPPAPLLGTILEKVGHEIAKHTPAKSGLNQLALKYQRGELGDGISTTVSYRLLGKDV